MFVDLQRFWLCTPKLIHREKLHGIFTRNLSYQYQSSFRLSAIVQLKWFSCIIGQQIQKSPTQKHETQMLIFWRTTVYFRTRSSQYMYQYPTANRRYCPYFQFHFRFLSALNHAWPNGTKQIMYVWSPAWSCRFKMCIIKWEVGVDGKRAEVTGNKRTYSLRYKH